MQECVMYVIVYEKIVKNRVNLTISVSRNVCTLPWINAYETLILIIADIKMLCV